MLIPSVYRKDITEQTSLSRRVNANSQPPLDKEVYHRKLIKKGEC